LVLIGQAGVVESSLEALSSSTDARVCNQKLVLVLGFEILFRIGLVIRRLAGGQLPRYNAEPMWGLDGRGI
jgi:hypothetical protein